jgi:predicted transcriptional regulator
MSTQRITITVPAHIAERLRKEAKQRRRPVSRLVAEALEQQEQERIRQLMIAGYKEMAEENLRLAEEALPAVIESWPRD